jgi:hypothetical protein
MLHYLNQEQTHIARLFSVYDGSINSNFGRPVCVYGDVKCEDFTPQEALALLARLQSESVNIAEEAAKLGLPANEMPLLGAWLKDIQPTLEKWA